jgi:phage gpG-like protein
MNIASVTLGQFAANLQQGQLIPPGPPSQLTKAIAGIVLNDIRKRFTTQTNPQGQRWARLAYPRIRGGNVVLSDTGVLRNSVKVDATPTGVVAYSNLEYAAIHNNGGTLKPRNTKFLAIPATPEALRYKTARNFPRKLSQRIGKRGRGGVLYEIRGGREIVHYYLAKSVKMPQREFLGVSNEALADIAIVASDYGFQLTADWMTRLQTGTGVARG